ncbi:MAG: C1 family peptidase [Deltaproteobacteria bacterium]|nr:C1 family peptidase [Deltaproteobacteria bacterium]
MTYRIARLGWYPDPLDHRDLDIADAAVLARLNRVVDRTSAGADQTGAASPVGDLRVDLRRWCSPIEDQGQVGSCTAQAVIGALEYFERKTRGEHVDASRLFLYRVTRRFLGWEGRGDTGAFVRSAIKSLRLFGAPPEEYWPYDEARFDAEPEAFHYAFGQNFKAVEYYRVPEDIETLKAVLAAGLPFAFGFTCFTSLDHPETGRTGVIPFPARNEQDIGGHAVLAVGFTDSHLLIRNSWGTGWGDKGYGYLPWSYFDGRRPLATDCWILVNAQWVPDTEPVLAAPPEVAATQALTARLVRARPVPPPRTSPRAAEEKLRPRVRVTRGRDITRELPIRFGLDPKVPRLGAGDLPVPMPTSKAAASLYLRSVRLTESFDFGLFTKATNELYLSAIVWDLSGQAPRVWPPLALGDADAAKARVHTLKEGQTIRFVGDGLQLWPSSVFSGGLFVRLLFMESDNDVRELGEKLAGVHKAIKDSPLPKALGGLLAAAGVVSAPALAAVAAAADVLTGVVADLLRKNGDDLVALFEGTYGAENVTGSRNDLYQEGGAEIELAFKVA